MMIVPDAERFFELLQTSLAEASFVKLTLAKYTGPEPDLLRVLVRPVTLRGERCLSFVWRHQTRDVTRNLSLAEALQSLRDLLGTQFNAAHLRTSTQDAELLFSKKGKSRLQLAATAAATDPPPLPHDRQKHRLLSIDRPFLAALGVTTAQHRLVPAMARKWKQINKFVEVFAHALATSALAGPGHGSDIHVVDFGSGKGYLTFAVHDHLCVHWPQGQSRVHVTGVELRPDMVALCENAARRLGLEGLHFEQGDVRGHPAQTMDVMIALHACDTATDHAIHLGLRAGASIIMCSPCCHKQIRPQLLSPHPMRPILQHGVHLGQQAEMLTDGLRAMLLDACGYDTQVFEFVTLEHTNKNKMILAVRREAVRAAPSQADVLAQIDDIKRFYGIRDHCLETLLKADGRL